MLAAHRRGGRTSFLSFAQRLGPLRGRPPAAAARRPASCACCERNLEESIAGRAGPGGDLGAAIAEHQASSRAAASATEAADGGVDLASCA